MQFLNPSTPGLAQQVLEVCVWKVIFLPFETSVASWPWIQGHWEILKAFSPTHCVEIQLPLPLLWLNAFFPLCVCGSVYGSGRTVLCSELWCWGRVTQLHNRLSVQGGNLVQLCSVVFSRERCLSPFGVRIHESGPAHKLLTLVRKWTVQPERKHT